MTRFGPRSRPATQVETWLPRPSFSPGSLAPFLWLDAGDTTTITSTNGFVSQWNDKSGNGRHVSQSTGNKQPSLVTNARNGLSTINFDGSNDSLTRSASGFPTSGNRHLFAAVKYTGNSTLLLQHIAIWGNNNSTLYTSWGLCFKWTSPSYFSTVHIWGEQNPTSASALATNTWHEVNASYDGTRTRLFTNGIEATPNTRTVTTAVAGSFLVGARTNGEAEYWTGEIGEIILYDFELSLADRQLVQGYLKSKWGTL
jgi:hypothetical protein